MSRFLYIEQVCRDPLVFKQDHLTLTILGMIPGIHEDEEDRISFHAERSDDIPPTLEDMVTARLACEFIMEPIYGPQQ